LGDFRYRQPVTSGWTKKLLVKSPGNAILLNGVGQNAKREIGVPGLSVAKLCRSAYAMIRFEIQREI
jgi:hypothetical protein